MNLGGRIALIRAERAIEQKDICAAVTGLSQQSLSNLETRDSKTSEFAIRIADHLKVSVRWLLDGVGDPAELEWPFRLVERGRWDRLNEAGKAVVEGAMLSALAQVEGAPSFLLQTVPKSAAQKSSPGQGAERRAQRDRRTGTS